METAITFDDVLLEPARSRIIPAEADLRTVAGKGLDLNLPIASAAMDTVTESAMAIGMAQLGGLGVVHKNLDIDDQAQEVAKVKRHESGVVRNPECVSPSMTVGEVLEVKDRRGFSGLPVVSKGGKVAGIVTNRDLRFETDLSRPVSEVMTPLNRLVTVKPGVKLSTAQKLMHEHRIERVIVVDAKGILKGLMTVKDIVSSDEFPDACKDRKGRLRVAAAVGAADKERVDILVDAEVDALVVDTAHGHSERVLEQVKTIKRRHPRVVVIGGNIATAEAAVALATAGADAVKVGIGPGSICTTRIVAGVGVPQVTAIMRVAKAFANRKSPPAIIADGGIRYSGDIAKALAAGADLVMIGSLFAGVEEAPGELELFQGRAYKTYRGMGSLSAMQRGSGDRYFQDTSTPSKMIPEGVEGRVPYSGKLKDVIDQLVGGVRTAMGYTGCATVPLFKKNAKLVRISTAGYRESHVHDIEITKESPNYRLD